MFFKKLSRTVLCLLACSLLLENVGFSLNSTQTYADLDRLACVSGTDKSSLFHDYMKIYAKYFDSLRDKRIKFLEIGILHGNSVKLWESYFTRAELHFIDIRSDLIQYKSNRSHYHFVDQANIVEMQNFANCLNGHLDIIIDDGGHRMEQQINSFTALFPYLNSGGLYIIEDLHTSYWQEWGGHGQIGHPATGPGTCVEFLKTLIDELNYSAAVTTCADQKKTSQELLQALNIYQSQIESIHFYQSLCIVIKK